ncbi:hypothetical protein GQ54DRAFT_297172 [Martensiomyces pterosporus]|nr:hypothetical protein GQ54DRAFT_297172 [Martensiomyces pterosporus]
MSPEQNADAASSRDRPRTEPADATGDPEPQSEKEHKELGRAEGADDDKCDDGADEEEVDEDKDEDKGEDKDEDEDGDEDEDEDALFVPEDEYAPLNDGDDDADNIDSDGGACDFIAHAINGGSHTASSLDLMLERKMDELAASFQVQQQASSDDTAIADKDTASASTTPPQAPEQIAPIEVRIDSKNRMPAEHIDQIKGIMAGIQISDQAIPEWAKRVPESAWMPKRSGS